MQCVENQYMVLRNKRKINGGNKYAKAKILL